MGEDRRIARLGDPPDRGEIRGAAHRHHRRGIKRWTGKHQLRQHHRAHLCAALGEGDLGLGRKAGKSPVLDLEA